METCKWDIIMEAYNSSKPSLDVLAVHAPQSNMCMNAFSHKTQILWTFSLCDNTHIMRLCINKKQWSMADELTLLPMAFFGGNSNVCTTACAFLNFIWKSLNCVYLLYTFHSSSLILTYIWYDKQKGEKIHKFVINILILCWPWSME